MYRRVGAPLLLMSSLLGSLAAADTRCPTAVSPRPMPRRVTPEELAAARQAPALGSFGIVINAGATLAANAPARAAFQRAAERWKGYISDPVTVTIDADLVTIADPSIIGQAGSFLLVTGYTDGRNLMVADADADDGILASLPTAAQASFFLPSGFGLTGDIVATKASVKALGAAGLDDLFGATDATIEFNTQFNFDFDSSDGFTPGTVDFETVAAHEIGHALGFSSEVDTIDTIAPASVDIGSLDLFRFRNGTANDPSTAAEFTTFARGMLPGDDEIFDDVAFEGRMSTGEMLGDGNQASHWKDDGLTGVFIGLMDPTLADETIYNITNADLRALDLIGWNIIGGVTICPPAPAAGCRLGLPLKSSIQLKDDPDDTKDLIKWKLGKADATAPADFADPLGGTARHHFCLYDGSGSAQPLLEAVVFSGGACAGKPCWKASGTTGFSYANKAGTANGVTAEKLKAGGAGAAQVQVKAQGVLLAMPALPLTLPVTAQLLISDGLTTACWETAFGAASLNDGVQFKAKGP